MASVAEAPPLAGRPSGPTAPAGRPVGLASGVRPVLRLVAYIGFALLAAERYASLELAPPRARVLAALLIVAAGGGALASSAALGDGGGRAGQAARTAVRALIVLIALYLALRIVGVPGHLLLPWHWGALGDRASHGVDGLSGWLWPYRGGDEWARTTILMVLPFALTASAALIMWPTSRAPALRRVAALGLLVALYVAGVVNASHSGWELEGALLLALLAAWLYLPDLDARAGASAVAWIVLGGAVAVGGSALVTGGQPWLNYRAWNPTGTVATGFQWDQSYGPITWSRSTAKMLEVSTQRPELWKVTSLDAFDGRRFGRTATPPGGRDFGSTPGVSRWFGQAAFTIAGLRTRLLPAAGSAVEVGWLSTHTQDVSVSADETATAPTLLSPGDSYQVSFYAPHPSAAQMRAAAPAPPTPYLYYTEMQLPAASGSGTVTVVPSAPGAPATDPAARRTILASPYAPVFRLARALAQGQRTEYDVAKRIESFLKSGYAYDEQPPFSQFPLISFLFTDRRGYCQQFSGAMTLMLRMDGIPARVAAGFLPGKLDPATGTYRVRAVDAHSWVEVYFSGIGWVAFDPTPPRSAAHSGPFQSPAATEGLLGRVGGSRIALPRRPPERGGAAVAAAHGTSAWPILVGVAGALVLLLAAWMVLASRRVRRGLEGDARGAVHELRAALRALGYPVAPRTTLAQLEKRLATTRGPEAARYVNLLGARLYAAAPASVGPTRRDRRALRRALSQGRGPLARLLSLIVLPPGL